MRRMSMGGSRAKSRMILTKTSWSRRRRNWMRRNRSRRSRRSRKAGGLGGFLETVLFPSYNGRPLAAVQ